MKLGDVYKSYDLVRERAARVKKATGLDWEIGGGSQVSLWVTLNGGDTLSEQAQDGICASLVKVFDKAAPKGLTAALAKQGTWDKAKIGASNNQVWCDFPNKVMSQISVEDFVELCDALMQQGSAEIQKVAGKPSESRKPNCSMQKKKESLLKKTEVVGDDEELTFSYDGVNVMVHEWGEDGEGNYVNEYNMDVRGSFNNLTDLIKDLAKTAIYDDDYLKPDNWTVLEVDRGSLTLSASVIQDGDGNSDPDGNYIADFNIQVDCTIKKPLHQTEIHNALSAAKIQL